MWILINVSLICRRQIVVNKFRGQDVVQSPPPLPQSPPPGSSSPVGGRPKTPESKSPKSKSPEVKERKSIISMSSSGSGGEPTARPRSPSPTSRPVVPLPEIQITRTESYRSTIELDEDKSKYNNSWNYPTENCFIIFKYVILICNE